MKNQGLNIHPIAALGSLENLNGSDFANRAHRNQNLLFKDFGLIRKSLKIHDESRTEI